MHLPKEALDPQRAWISERLTPPATIRQQDRQLVDFSDYREYNAMLLNCRECLPAGSERCDGGL